jgi:hypothetical protein
MEKFLNRTGVFIIGIILVFSFFRINGFFNVKKSEIIKGDGFGYYSYLPAMFIYGDYSQQFLKVKFPKHYKGPGIPEYMQIIDGNPVDKHFFGTAVMMYPFFITAHLLSFQYKQAADGYSIFYQYFIGLAAVFYVFLGIYFLNKLLRIYGANTYQSLFVCVLVVFGTNLFYFSTVEPSMSHAYGFAAITAFLYFAKGIFENRKAMFIVPAFFSFGLLILIRPFNAIILLALPFLAGSNEKLFQGIKFLIKNYLDLIIGILIILILISFQLFIWFKQTGQFFVFSDTFGKFNFDRPHFFETLFGYQKGLFIYTPLFLLALAGFFPLYRKSKFSVATLAVFLVLLVYIMSCWHQWYYGSSFFRPMVEFFALFAVLLFYAIKLLKNRKVKFALALVCLFFIYVNQVQSYQYRKFILNWEKMSYYKFWRVFLKTDDKWRGYIMDNPERKDLTGYGTVSFSTDFDNPDSMWTRTSIVDVGKKAHSGRMVSVLDAQNVFSSTLEIHKNWNITASQRPAIIASGYIKVQSSFHPDKLKLVISYDDKDGKTYYYTSRLVDGFYRYIPGWRYFEVAIKLEKRKSETDVIKVYFWNLENKSYWLDDVTIQFMERYE